LSAFLGSWDLHFLVTSTIGLEAFEWLPGDPLKLSAGQVIQTPVEVFHGCVRMPAQLEEERAVELAEIFRLLGDANRLRIAVVCLDSPLCVGDIAQHVGLSASLVSHHLRLLRAARFVRSQKRGKQVFYGVADDHVRCVINDMVAHVDERRSGMEDDDGGY